MNDYSYGELTPAGSASQDYDYSDYSWESYKLSARKRRRKRKIRNICIAICSLLIIAVSVILVRSARANRQRAESVYNDGYYRYFHSQISGQDLVNYDAILTAVNSYEDEVAVKAKKPEKVIKIAQEVYADNPECFWLDPDFEIEYYKGDRDNNVTLKLVYNCTAEVAENRRQEIDAIVTPVIEACGGLTEYQKVKAVYDYIIENTVYDENYDNQNCYSVIVDGKGVCAGYAAATQLMLNRLNIPCIHVFGTADGVKHGWNIVNIGGKWYHIDTTWGDPVTEDGQNVVSYDYFLVKDRTVLKDHKYDDGYHYPGCHSGLKEKEQDDLSPRVQAQETEDNTDTKTTDVVNSPVKPSPVDEGAEIEQTREPNFEIHFLDVGQAESTLVICDGHAMLVDGGNVDDSDFMYSYLRRHDIKELDYVVCSHPHIDHVGGLAGALNFAVADKVYSRETFYDTKAFSNFLKYVSKQGLELTVPDDGDTFELGSAEVQIIGPINYRADNMNNNSTVLRIVYGDTTFLLTGDMEYEEENDLVNSNYELKSDVLKVCHHGSDTSSSYSFLYEVEPQIAVISVGENPYGHPSERVLSRLEDCGAAVFRTDERGTIIITSDGENLSVKTEY